MYMKRMLSPCHTPPLRNETHCCCLMDEGSTPHSQSTKQCLLIMLCVYPKISKCYTFYIYSYYIGGVVARS